MNISPVSFGKKNISKVPVRNKETGGKELLNFVEYDSPRDSYEVKKASEKWLLLSKKNGKYANYIADHIQYRHDPNSKFYGIEDEKGNIHALCELYVDGLSKPDEDDVEATISFVSVNPKNSYGSNNRKYSKLGTSLFREIIQLAKSFKAKSIDFCDNSNGFWDKMPCCKRRKEGSLEYTLSDKKYDECISKLDKMI